MKLNQKEERLKKKKKKESFPAESPAKVSIRDATSSIILCGCAKFNGIRHQCLSWDYWDILKNPNPNDIMSGKIKMHMRKQ